MQIALLKTVLESRIVLRRMFQDMIVLRRIFNYSEEDISGNDSSEEDKSEEDISGNNSSKEDKSEEEPEIMVMRKIFVRRIFLKERLLGT